MFECGSWSGFFYSADTYLVEKTSLGPIGLVLGWAGLLHERFWEVLPNSSGVFGVLDARILKSSRAFLVGLWCSDSNQGYLYNDFLYKKLPAEVLMYRLGMDATY